MIKQILVRDPKERLNAEAILEHPWVQGDTPDIQLTNIPTKIKEYNAKQRLKKAGQVIIAVQRLNRIMGMSKKNILNK